MVEEMERFALWMRRRGEFAKRERERVNGTVGVVCVRRVILAMMVRVYMGCVQEEVNAIKVDFLGLTGKSITERALARK